MDKLQFCYDISENCDHKKMQYCSNQCKANIFKESITTHAVPLEFLFYWLVLLQMRIIFISWIDKYIPIDFIVQRIARFIKEIVGNINRIEKSV